MLNFILKYLPSLRYNNTFWYVNYLVWRYLTTGKCTECRHPKSSHYWVDGWNNDVGKMYCQHNGNCNCGYHTGR